MVDSIKIEFNTSAVITNQMKDAPPFKVKTISDQDGVILGRSAVMYNAKSPLTNAGYKITPIFDKSLTKPIVVSGYLVEINIPACTVGNNVLPQNLVWVASDIAMQLLQHFLLTHGCSAAIVKRMSLDAATIKEVDLTYLIECNSHADAIELNDQFYWHADAVVNSHPATGKPNDVFRIGNGPDSTVYVKYRDLEISSYVKSSKSSKAFCNLKGSNAEAVYSVGSERLRCTVKLRAGYLLKRGLEKPAAWKMEKGHSNPHAIGIEIIRERLRSDENLRAVSPKPSYIAKLSPDDQEVLVWHLLGNDARQHALFANQPPISNKYGIVRGRILTTLRIDIAIPWVIQSQQVSPRLAKTLVFNGQFRPPQDIEHLCFCRKTMRGVLRRLDAMVQRASQSLLTNQAPVAPQQLQLPTSKPSGTTTPLKRKLKPLMKK